VSEVKALTAEEEAYCRAAFPSTSKLWRWADWRKTFVPRIWATLDALRAELVDAKDRNERLLDQIDSHRSKRVEIEAERDALRLELDAQTERAEEAEARADEAKMSVGATVDGVPVAGMMRLRRDLATLWDAIEFEIGSATLRGADGLKERLRVALASVETQLPNRFPCCGGSDEFPPEHTQDCPDGKSGTVALAAISATTRGKREHCHSEECQPPLCRCSCHDCTHAPSRDLPDAADPLAEVRKVVAEMRNAARTEDNYPSSRQAAEDWADRLDAAMGGGK